jgi:hypothetical protein
MVSHNGYTGNVNNLNGHNGYIIYNILEMVIIGSLSG